MKKLMVTGSRGSAARLMIKYLREQENPPLVYALCRSEQYETNLPGVLDITCDLTDPFAVQDTLRSFPPDCILHLASNADVKASWGQPSSVLRNNIEATTNLLEALRYNSYSGNRIKLVLCSTSEVYGIVPEEKQPITEETQIAPINPYAVSKTTQDLLAQVYSKAYDLPIVITRMFGYINPERKNLFASSFAAQIALIEKGRRQFVKHGNLSSSRALLDPRDVASAYWAACTKGKPGEIYNIGATDSHTVEAILQKLCKLSTETSLWETTKRLRLDKILV